MEKYQDKLDWIIISFQQNLSEEFIEKFKDKVDWNEISECQNRMKNSLRNLKIE